MLLGGFGQRLLGELPRRRGVAVRIGKKRSNHSILILFDREFEAYLFSEFFQYLPDLVVEVRQFLFYDEDAEIEPCGSSYIGKIPFGLQGCAVLLNRSFDLPQLRQRIRLLCMRLCKLDSIRTFRK